jgi:hypothetical protein
MQLNQYCVFKNKLMKHLLILCCAALMAVASTAQSCTYCNKTPKVANYDLDILVPKPSQPGDSLTQWYRLFFLSKYANGKLIELNKGCVRFTQPMVTNSQGENVVMVGVTSTMLPQNSKPSLYGDYIITGSVMQSGNGYLMRMKLLTACGGNEVAAVSIPFNTSESADYIKEVAESAAMQLSPVADKINEFAKEQRDQNKEVAYANWGSASITVVPKKRNLAAGQETEVQISMKDCDGFPLSNREISFSKNSIGGMPILGTTGGTVTPSTVTTDARGKAKVKFKMGEGKTAIIAAHYLFERPYGCPDAMVGSAPINSIPIKVSVEYEIGNDITFKPEMNLGGVKSKGGEEHSMFTRSYRAFFYHYPSKTPPDMLLCVVPEYNQGMNNIYEMEDGYFLYSKRKKETTMEIYLIEKKIGEELHEKAITESNFGRVNPKKRATTFTFYKKNGLDPMRFNIDFRYENEEEEHEIGSGGFPGGVSVVDGDDGVTIKTIKIDDPDSPYKTQYVVYLDRKVADVEALDKMLGTNFKSMYKDMNYENKGTERLTIRMLVPY